jgi:kumamolisin
MPHAAGFTPLEGSHRDPLAGAELVGPTPPDSEVSVSVLVRRGGSHDASAQVAALAAVRPSEREHVAPEDFAARYGASTADLDKVAAYAEGHGLEVAESDAARRTVVLRGSAKAMSEAFDVTLEEYSHPELGTYRGRTGTVGLPAELGGVVEGVLGLDDRPAAHPRFVFSSPDAAVADSGRVAAPAAAVPFTPPQVASLYEFPDSAGAGRGAGAGHGQCIGLIELGGGYHPSDLHAYFHSLGVHRPRVVSVGVDGATNSPGSEADVEVVLDIEVSGSIANEATVAVYFAPNTTQGFLDAITTAIHDTRHRPSVLSISWGSAESTWTEQAMDAMDQAFADAALLGVTVCVAAGDHGAGDGVAGKNAHADFPASSPHALGCGGTHLEAAGGAIAVERVWNNGNGWAGGGGVSDHFDPPAWQAGAGVPPSVNPGGRVGRGVPDVAGDADSETGYRIHVNGEDTVVGGTSAVAPLWAALTAILNERKATRLGFLNPTLYALAPPAASFHDIVAGNNVVAPAPGYQAGPGWDACTGLGTPIGAGLLAAL